MKFLNSSSFKELYKFLGIWLVLLIMAGAISETNQITSQAWYITFVIAVFISAAYQAGYRAGVNEQDIKGRQ